MERDSESLKAPIIIDIGSGEIKTGFRGDEKPKIIFKNYIGEPKYRKVLRVSSKNPKKLMTNM